MSREWTEQVIATYEGRLTGYALQITGDLETARDVVQDTFEKLCSQSPEQLNGKLAAWLYTVCRNRAFDVRKKDRRMTTLTEGQAAAIPSLQPLPSVSASLNEEQAMVIAAVNRLPEKPREVFRLKFGDGLSYREISEVTGYSTGAISGYMNEALTTLRTTLAPQRDANAAQQQV